MTRHAAQPPAARIAIAALAARAATRARRSPVQHISVESIFEEASIDLAHALEFQGFRVWELSAPRDPSGSQLVSYHQGTKAIRLWWDGREKLFLLQQQAIRSGESEPSWVDLVSERYDPESDSSERANEIVVVLEHAITYLGG
jgi:hypothetical protein